MEENQIQDSPINRTRQQTSYQSNFLCTFPAKLSGLTFCQTIPT